MVRPLRVVYILEEICELVVSISFDMLVYETCEDCYKSSTSKYLGLSRNCSVTRAASKTVLNKKNIQFLQSLGFKVKKINKT